MYSSYNAGLKEVDRYLAGKYGQETINSIKRGDKAKAIAIGAGVVAGSTILGVGVWHGNKAHKNNLMRKAEDDAYIKVGDSESRFKEARTKAQDAYNDEQFARAKAREAANDYYYPKNEPRFKESREQQDQVHKNRMNWEEAKARAAAKRTANADINRSKQWTQYNKDYQDYILKADKREANVKGLWRREGDDERDKRHKNISYMK